MTFWPYETNFLCSEVFSVWASLIISTQNFSQWIVVVVRCLITHEKKIKKNAFVLNCSVDALSMINLRPTVLKGWSKIMWMESTCQIWILIQYIILFFFNIILHCWRLHTIIFRIVVSWLHDVFGWSHESVYGIGQCFSQVVHGMLPDNLWLCRQYL